MTMLFFNPLEATYGQLDCYKMCDVSVFSGAISRWRLHALFFFFAHSLAIAKRRVVARVVFSKLWHCFKVRIDTSARKTHTCSKTIRQKANRLGAGMAWSLENRLGAGRPRHDTAGFSPFYPLFSRHPVLPFKTLLPPIKYAKSYTVRPGCHCSDSSVPPNHTETSFRLAAVSEGPLQ